MGAVDDADYCNKIGAQNCIEYSKITIHLNPPLNAFHKNTPDVAIDPTAIANLDLGGAGTGPYLNLYNHNQNPLATHPFYQEDNHHLEGQSICMLQAQRCEFKHDPCKGATEEQCQSPELKNICQLVKEEE